MLSLAGERKLIHHSTLAALDILQHQKCLCCCLLILIFVDLKKEGERRVKNDSLVWSLSKLGKSAVLSIKLASVSPVAASSTASFACVYKFTAVIGRRELFEELPMRF